MAPASECVVENSRVCIIPARGGSKRLPRKNVRMLAGHPLVAHSIMAATQSDCFTDVIVSSDDDEVLEVAQQYGATPDRRPAPLAGDTAKAVEVVSEFLRRPGHESRWDVVSMCLPTCPLRTATHLKEAMEVFLANRGASPFLVGVTPYAFPPQLALTLDQRGLIATPVHDGAYKNTRSQDIAACYHPNGSVYIADVKAYLESATFFGASFQVYIIPEDSSIDIDYEYQFDIAEYALMRRKA